MPLIFVEFIIRENRTNVTRRTREYYSVADCRNKQEEWLQLFFTTRVCIDGYFAQILANSKSSKNEKYQLNFFK